MVSYSFAFFIAAILALSQVALASPSSPPPCKEVHPNEKNIKLVEPYFHKGKDGNVMRAQWKSDDNTRVQLKHLFQNDGNLLLIKTKDRAVRGIQLGFQTNGDIETKRFFRLKPHHTCYVPSATTTGDDDVLGINAVSYYRRK
jgi:hypothetical protein